MSDVWIQDVRGDLLRASDVTRIGGGGAVTVWMHRDITVNTPGFTIASPDRSQPSIPENFHAELAVLLTTVTAPFAIISADCYGSPRERWHWKVERPPSIRESQ